MSALQAEVEGLKGRLKQELAAKGSEQKDAQAAAEKQLEAALDTARAAEKRAVAAEARAAELETAAAEAAEASQGVRESVSAEVRGCPAQCLTQ